MSTEVFISYAAKDRTRVLDLVERLRVAGVSVWIDQMGIEGATMWSQEIVAAIRSCKVLILAISENSAGSENVVKEVALASEGRKRILPVYLAQAEIPESMAYQLAGIQRIEFFEEQEDAALQAIIRALSKLGVNVADEASAAAAGASNIAAHGANHPTGKNETKGEAAVWLKVAAAVVGLAVLGMAGTFFFGSSTTTAPMPIALATLDTNRVVVLPFKVIGTSNETADMGDGLVSTLTSKLQPLQNLVVIAKESARKFKDSERSPREIGQALGTGTIVTGEIQTGSGNIQVNIQLINANTEALGWGNTFTKTKNDFLDLQNEIATKLASELKGGLADDEAQQLAKKATDNPKAQIEYQAGRREWNKRNKEGFENAIKHFERAIELDPNYADPYVGLGDTYGLLPVYNFAETSDTMPKAKAYAEKAIKLNPNLASAYNSIAWVLHTYEYDWVGAESNYKKAVQLNPNYATGHHWYGEYLYTMGKPEDGYAHLLKATELDPGSKIIKCNFAFCCLMLNKNEEALNIIEEALEIDPMFHFSLSIKYYRLGGGDISGAILVAEEARKKYPKQPVYLQLLFNLNWTIGNREKALNYFLEILDKYHDSYQKTEIAGIYFKMNQPDNAYRWLQNAINDRETLVPQAAVDPAFERFRFESRFQKAFKNINHPMYMN